LHLPRAYSLGILLLLGLALAQANLWIAAARTTIPLALDGQVREKERRLEKKPGVDDVCLVTLDDGTSFQVDIAVYDAIIPGCTLNKDAWSRQLHVDGVTVDLDWSLDFRRMLWTMPAAVLVLILVVSWEMMRPRPDSVPGSSPPRSELSPRAKRSS